MQKLIAERYREDFMYKTNDLLNQGFNVIPGTTYAVPLHRDYDHFFSITLWRDGKELTLTANQFNVFRATVTNYLNMGFSVVVGTLYASQMGRLMDTNAPTAFDNYFFNVLNKD